MVGVPGAGWAGLFDELACVMLGAGPSMEARRRLFLPRAMFDCGYVLYVICGCIVSLVRSLVWYHNGALEDVDRLQCMR